MRDWRIIVLALSLWSFFSCSKESALPQEQRALQFSTVESKSNLSLLFTTFKVWGEVCVASSSEPLIQGYRVNYINNNNQWSYTQGEGTEGQEMKYWSYSADEYRFHAGAPLERVNEITASSLTLQVNKTRSQDGTTLFTQPYVVKRGDAQFGNTVNLKFTYANCRVNVAVKCKAAQKVTVSNIQLTPPYAVNYPTSCTMQLSYDWSRQSISLTSLTKQSEANAPLEFAEITIPAESANSVESSSPLYMIPDAGITGQWRATLKIDGIAREVLFTVDKGWESGKSYIYSFLYTDQATLLFLGTETVLFEGENMKDGGNHNFS